MRRWLNRAADVLFVPGTERFWAQRMRGRVTVLVYHRVSDHVTPDFLDLGGVPRITTAALHRELSFLLDLGARFLTFRDLREGAFPSTSEIGVIVSFDDGFRDSYEHGLPLMESLGGKAVIFQCTAMLDGSSWLPEHRLYRLLYSDSAETRGEVRSALAGCLAHESGAAMDDRTLIEAALTRVPSAVLLDVLDAGNEAHALPDGLYPDASALQVAHAAGHEIGSHGHRHLHRLTIDAACFERELRESRELLTEILEQAPAAFSYPFGSKAPGDEKVCSSYYAYAATCERSRIGPGSDPGALGRFSWPGLARNGLRLRRWLLTGSI